VTLLAFLIGLLASKLATRVPTQRLKMPTSQTFQEPKAAIDQIVSCNEPPILPSPIKDLLNRHFPGWNWPTVDDEECRTVKNCGGAEAHPLMIRGDFDGDGRIDVAVLIQHGVSSDDRGLGAWPNTYIVAFLNCRSRYRMVIVTKEAGASLLLMHKGASDYDYDSQCNFKYANDTIFSGMGMGGTSYIFKNGYFRPVVTSD